MTALSKANRRTGAGWLFGIGMTLVLPFSGASAQDMALPEGFKTEPLLKSTETRDGDALVYPEGTPQVTSVIGTIEPGGRTPLHQHPVPTFVHILEGQVELRTEGREPKTFEPGQAYMEALNRDHQLFNNGNEPAKVLVVFMGAEGTPTTVAAEPVAEAK